MAKPTDVLVGRQGIYDVEQRIGYELLFRNVRVAGATRPTGDQMTAAVLFGAMTIGLDDLVGDKLVFCNADRGVLTGEIPVLLPPERTVIEIVETVVVDDGVLAGAQRLVDAGYRLALDNFTWGGGGEALLPYVSIVKVDLLMATERDVVDIVARCKDVADVRMLAERVERWEDRPRLATLGFELFQGYALETPAVVPGRTITPVEVTRLRAAADILSGNPDFDQLEDILRREPALAHHVIQLASIGRLGEPRRSINTIREALVLAGTRQIRNWIAVLQARPAEGGADAHDAFANVLLRARACELLAQDALDRQQAALAFTAGMLSALNGILQVPAEEIMAKLSISDELAEAALGGESPLGRVVRDAADYRYRAAQAPDEHVGTQTHSGIPIERFDAAFASAFLWAMESAAAVA